jgi:methylated-DNA-[protein]-cysteine S-methyltransferase
VAKPITITQAIAVTQAIIDTPVGQLGLVADGEALVRIDFHAEGRRHAGALSGILVETERQLRAYFSGTLRRFDLPLAPHGTPFQLAVWHALVAIPYGETRSYAEQARAIGRPSAVRAVGAANGQNPIPIVIPCHRVIGSNGKLVGFGGGLATKRALLDLEQGVVKLQMRK